MNFEIHITIDNCNTSEFKKDCEVVGVKPILIETQNNFEFGEQLMTSSKHEDVFYMKSLEKITQFLKQKYNIIRSKVEIFPLSEKNKDFIYYETHLRLKLPKGFDNTFPIDKRFHLSKNLFKTDENYNYQMMTYRDSNINIIQFKNVISEMKLKLKNLGIECDKVEIEECIYDSNINIDKTWIS